MSNPLLPVASPADFRLASLVRSGSSSNPTEQAVMELCGCFDELLQKTPLECRDFFLRSLRSFGLPIDYPSLPFWVERAAKHLFTILYPTLRNTDWTNPSPEVLGINPITLQKYREAFITSRAKDDGKDAEHLAELLLIHHEKLTPWQPEDQPTRLLQQLVFQRRGVVDQRTALVNELQATGTE